MPLTSLLDMRRLQGLFSDPQKNQDEIQSLGPRFTDSIEVTGVAPNVREAIMGGGMVTSLPQELRNSGQDFSNLTPGGTHLNVGGEGVAVQDEEQGGKKRDWTTGLSAIGVGLSDIFNSFGNQRNRVEGGGYELMKQHLRDKQVEALQRKHQMFDDAYQEARALPPEVYADPERFGSLIQAAQKLRTSGEAGNIDDEKAIQAFLTEAARFRPDIKDLTEQAELSRKIAESQQLEQARVQALSQLRGVYGEEMGPSAGEKWKYEQDQDKAGWAYREKSLQEQAQARRDVANINAGARRDARSDQGRQAAGRYLASSYENEMRRWMPPAQEMEMMSPEEREQAIGSAHQRALMQITPNLINAAKQNGIDFQESNDPTQGWKYQVDGQAFQSLPEAMQYLRTLLF